MQDEKSKEKLREFCKEFVLALVASVRSLSLYPPEHPETKNKLEGLTKRLDLYLSQRPSLTLLLFGDEVIVEGMPLPELTKLLPKLLQRLDAIHLERILFRRGLSAQELIRFLQLLAPLLQDPKDGEIVLAKNQDRLPHILAGRLPLDAKPQVSYEQFVDVLKLVRQTMLSFSAQLKELFSDVDGPLPGEKVALAKESAETIHKMMKAKELPLKILIFQRSPDPSPYVHALNVCALSIAIAEQVGLEKDWIQQIALGAIVHDIGLYLSPSSFLSTTSVLTLDEKTRYWDHPVRGAELLLASPGIPELVAIMAYEHHLHYDGKGFPAQQRPRELNLGSMIASIADTYDNLRRDRPGQKALSMAETLNTMNQGAGKDFHPLLFKAFRDLVKAQAKTSEQ
jgi:HD-GYP domain-containing protein (c-di-GMP phosphodiesterase class II)